MIRSRSRFDARWQRPASMMTDKRGYSVRAMAGEDVTEILIYDFIDEFGVRAEDVARDLATINSPLLKVRINSGGGDVFDGVAIYNSLMSHQARVEVSVDGHAASAASVIAMAGDHIVMAEASMMMIHEPWGGVMGGADEMRAYADLLDKIALQAAHIYARRSGLDLPVVQQMLAAETWLTPEDAVDVGLADEVGAPSGVEMRADVKAMFKNSPQPEAPADEPEATDAASDALRARMKRRLRLLECAA